jgi:hypothetical protein
MSFAASRILPGNRHRCRCGSPAVYRVFRRRSGFRCSRIVARPDHPLCPRCWRSEKDRARAQQIRPWRTARLVLPRGVVIPLPPR